MAAQTSQSSSQLLKPLSYDYGVFLNFIVEDTNKDFTHSLRAALKEARIPTLLDDRELLPAGGENIFTADLNMIRSSRISIVVFSKGYASSSRCLDELVEIVHCKNTKGQALIPIFYHVDPSDIQKETGTFWKAFVRQEEQFWTDTKRVQRWRAALTEAAHASGWVLKNKYATGQEEEFRTDMERLPRWGAALHESAHAFDWELEDEYENGSEKINKIVEEVLDLMEVLKDSECMDSRVKMIQDLNLETSDICIVGMSWMGGKVNTTLAKVVYNEICSGFEGSSFISNISEISRDSKYGLVHLQKQLLYDILKMKNIPSINNVDEGINLIEETIQGKRVLIVLDCVDDLKQLNALVGNSICFGPGSRVIATSRGEHLLTELEAHGKYEVQGLHYWNSLKLFSWRASMMGHDYKVKFNPQVNVYNYKQLDMAGEGSEKQMTSEPKAVVFGVEAVEITSNFDVLKKLNLSWTNIKSLPESIVRLVNLKQLEVLNLERTAIRDLPKNPRWPMLLELFLHNNKELRNIPPLFFDYMTALQTLNLSRTCISSLPKSIVNLASLKRLILRNCHDFKKLSPEVGELKELEVLDLEGTMIWDLPENPKWPRLLQLVLHYNKELRKIPPLFFDYMTALQTLDLSGTGISSLPESIVNLASLKRLILRNCHDFKKLSPEVGELKELEVLDLEGTMIWDLPENPKWPRLLQLVLHYNKELRKIPPLFFDYMTALQTLDLSGTGISSLPESIVNLASLKRLILRNCHDFNKLSHEVGELEELEVLDIEGTEIWDLPENPRWPMLLQFVLHNNKKFRKIPPLFFNYMTALQTLDLSETGISSLPESVVKLVSLKRLILSRCDNFKELSPEVGELKELEVLDLEGTEIRVLPKNPRWPMLLELFLHNNKELRKIPPLFFDYMTALQTLNLSKTGVRSLPESVVRLVSLKRLFLSYCHRFMRLSPKVGELEQLEVLDLEGTEIMDLPKEIMKLTNLTCLKFSIYGYMGDGSSAMQSDAPVPRNVISTLSLLEELKISVNPEDKQCSEMVIKFVIIHEVCRLVNLKTLHFYFPRVDLLKHFILKSAMWKHPSELLHFRFTVGHHVKRIMPRLPREAELELEKWERCLKYTNGVTVPSEIQKVLRYSNAFFLEQHGSVRKLSDFGIGNIEQLKCCVVGECNEVEVIMDEASGLGSLEYLCIYYMKNLRSIWKGPVQLGGSFSSLKYLTLRTCPQLTTIFPQVVVFYIWNLEELTVDDCPSIETIVSCETSAELKTSDRFLPNLKRMSLHYVPELISISSGLKIARRLQWLSFYNCPKLKKLLNAEVSSKHLTHIKGERSWWEALEWRSGRPSHLDEIFVPINILDC